MDRNPDIRTMTLFLKNHGAPHFVPLLHTSKVDDGMEYPSS